MGLFDRFRKGRSPQEAASAGAGDIWWRTVGEEGISLRPSAVADAAAANDAVRLQVPGLSAALRQMHDDGLAERTGADWRVDWDSLQDAAARADYDGLLDVLALPRAQGLRPMLSSRGALTDADFGIHVSGWMDDGGRRLVPERVGALLRWSGREGVMSAAQWALWVAVRTFARRPPAERADQAQRLAWGRIRRLAIDAGADLSDFLLKTVVLTPERLELRFRKSDAVGDDAVIEIIPGFQGAPAQWLEKFDGQKPVPERYDLPQGDGGLVQVLIAPEVRTVLQEIKRLDGRRVAGARAQAFLLNPYATLGEAASRVIDERQFESACIEAGLTFDRFTPVVERAADGRITRIGLQIETPDAEGLSRTRMLDLDGPALDRFITRLERAIHQEHALVFWEGHELELLPEAPAHLQRLQQARALRDAKPLLVTYEQIHDLSAYSQRVLGVGEEAPYFSPYIAKQKSGPEWFPSDVITLISYTPPGATEPLAIPVGQEAAGQLEQAIDRAGREGASELSLPWLPQPMPLEEARRIIEAFKRARTEIDDGRFRPPGADGESPSETRPKHPRSRVALVMGANIDAVDYEERRQEALREPGQDPHVPATLAKNASLLDHQKMGVARMQHLYALRETHTVRGMVLADDMGLGKTLQLLTLMASIQERDPVSPPALVVAPVSLLENWKEEAEKFYPGAFRILTAYGDALADLRVPKDRIDERLRQQDGLVKFLRPDWVGEATLVLTTYETLRDLEFSFAAQRWSLMVCDEAQRIKNPAAMVTRSAKKQNAAFKIACTGTPVENTLADLWCLFDFVQPGLLGALNEFGRTYRRPIEIDARDAAALQRIEELRARIQPQILRRTKLEVAKDLPRKIIDEGCRRLPLSLTQRQLYAQAIDGFRKRAEPGSVTPFKNQLGLLHYLRLVCTDPRPHGLTVFKPEPLDGYRAAAPKLDWLLARLRQIQAAGEKVIVFCEFREIQRLLQHYIAQVFGFEADIINGDTEASASHAQSRQKRIKAFQAQPGFGVIILSPVAVGFGVNIQAANHVVHYTRTWNPAKEDQASDRAWRIGQTREVHVYYPVVSADDFTTFDVKLDQLLEAKRALAGDMLNGSGDVQPGDFALGPLTPGGGANLPEPALTIDEVQRMDWRHFEGLAAALWAKQGFDAYCTPASNDHGVDVVAVRGDEGVLIQTKTSSRDRQSLGWDAVRDVVAGAAHYERLHAGVTFRRVGMTNQGFNASAIDKAALNDVELIDRDRLAQLLADFPITLTDVTRAVSPSFMEVAASAVTGPEEDPPAGVV